MPAKVAKGVSLTRGITRWVFAWYLAYPAYVATTCCHKAWRVAPSTVTATILLRWFVICTLHAGCSTRLRYQEGCCGKPPYDATTMKVPASFMYRSGTVRGRLDFRPVVVRRSTGHLAMRPPIRPRVMRYSATCRGVTSPRSRLRLRVGARSIGFGLVLGYARGGRQLGLGQGGRVVELEELDRALLLQLA